MRACVAAMATLLCLVGCGGDDHKTSAVRLTAVPVDCSPSMRGDSENWPDQISRAASAVLAREEAIVVGCFYGRQTTVHFGRPYDGRDVPELTGGAIARQRYAARWGLQLRGVFATQLVPHKEGGTNWLGALETSAKLGGVQTILMFSDLVQQAEGVDLTKALTSAQITSVAQTWRPRLARLRGLKVLAVGGGQGVARPDAARRGEQLFLALQRMVGFQGTTYPDLPDPRML